MISSKKKNAGEQEQLNILRRTRTTEQLNRGTEYQFFLIRKRKGTEFMEKRTMCFYYPYYFFKFIVQILHKLIQSVHVSISIGYGGFYHC